MGVSSSWQNNNACVPQGSILGPSLFIINDIVNLIHSNIRLFADDTILYKIINQPVVAGIELNTDLKNINLSERASEWLVNFQSLKTNSLIINKKRNKASHPILTMNQTQIDEIKEHKDLNIVLSDDLSWTNHIDSILEINVNDLSSGPNINDFVIKREI